MNPTKFRTLYAWPYRKEKPTIDPSDYWRCPISGRLHPIYKKSDCTELFMVHIPPLELTEDKSDSEEDFEIVRIAVNKNVDKKQLNNEFGATDLSENAEEGSSSKELPNNDMKDNLEPNWKANGYVRIKKLGWCAFCKSNGESPEMYLTHNVMSKKDHKVTCPVLRQFCCPICKSTGDNAHTLKYCPYRPPQEQGLFPRFVRSATGKVKLCRH